MTLCPKKTNRVAVAILNWNGRKLLEEFLPSIVAHTPRNIADIIVADNGSTDSSLAYLADAYPGGEVEVMAFDSNHGFAQGYNLTLKALERRYEYAVLLNSDVAAREDWLSPLLRFMEANPQVAACAPKLLSYSRPDHFEYAGASGGFIDRHGYPYCRGRIFDTCEEDHGQYDSPINVDWATGAALMVRIPLYLKAGGLDPSFFAHMEEIDLCWRLRRLGYRIAIVPQGRLFHLGGGSLPPSDPRKTYLNYRNNLIMLHKNLPADTRRPILLRRRLLDSIAWGMNILTLHWDAAKAIVKAHNDFRHMRNDYAPRTDHASGTDLIPRPNIILDYFLRRRRRFSDLS
ncbi:MAG: glycosyltransferase family 2 protein [Pseudoflavonifractor sp.]|nr:glycosyltransferase family 2 protein [Alloprevotella sp.]MCM1117644.1 glycosyltransferase family 2 protein [Pseudoflavonifractor sp.]